MAVAHRGILARLACLLAVLGVLSLPGRSSAAFPGGDGRIAFVRFAAGSNSIWAINPDGTGLRRLVRKAIEPAWAPDGRKLAYTVAMPVPPGRNFAAGAIFVADRNGAHGRRVTPKRIHGAHQAAWSPTGKRLVFVDRGVIYTIGVRGHGLKRISRNPRLRTPPPGNKLLKQRARDSHPAWSPDGRTIAYVEHRGQDDIWAMRPDGSHVRQLTRLHSRGDLAPDWSPDSRQIIYTHDVGVYVISAGGTDRRLLTNAFGPARGPAWSPDGTQLALATTTGLVVANPDGSHPHQIAPAGAQTPDWQPLRP